MSNQAKAERMARQAVGKAWGIRKKLTATTNSLFRGTIVECDVAGTKLARTRHHYVWRMVIENAQGVRKEFHCRTLPR